MDPVDPDPDTDPDLEHWLLLKKIKSKSQKKLSIQSNCIPPLRILYAFSAMEVQVQYRKPVSWIC